MGTRAGSFILSGERVKLYSGGDVCCDEGSAEVVARSPPPEVADELKAFVHCDGDSDDVSMADWAAFHRSWMAKSSMAAHLGGIVTRRREVANLLQVRCYRS